MARHLSDFVKEQSAALGHLEDAAFGCYRTGKGPLLVAEEFGLDEVFRQGRAVDADEGGVVVSASVVDGVGDHVFASARLSGDEHRGVHRGRQVHHASHVLKHGAVAHQGGLLFQLIGTVGLQMGHLFQLGCAERPADDFLKFVQIIRAHHVMLGAGPEGLGCSFQMIAIA